MNSLAWGPPTKPSILSTEQTIEQEFLQPKRLVTGGSDRQVIFWTQDPADPSGLTFKAQKGDKLEHEEIVRSVAWAGNIGLKNEVAASCSEDGNMIIWRADS